MSSVIVSASPGSARGSPIGWLAMRGVGIAGALIALTVDAQSLDAALLLSRCRAEGWVDTLHPSAWPAHALAFRWTMGWMLLVALCGPVRAWIHGQGRAAWVQAVSHVAKMGIAMMPACALAAALASPLSPKLSDPGAAFVYGATMLVVSMALLRVRPVRRAVSPA